MSLEDQLYPLLRLYDRSPTWVRAAAGSMYRRLPASVRLGARYAEFKQLARRFEESSPAEVEAWRFAQAQEIIRYAAAHCPFYRDRFRAAGFDPARLSAPADLDACPLLEKRDLQDHRDALASDAVPAAARLYITSGGSTGVPVGFYLQKGVSRPKEQAFLETMWARAGYTEGARLVVIRGHVTSSSDSGRIDSYDATRDWLMLSSYHLTSERAAEYLERIERFRPDFIHAYPSSILQLAEFLEARGQAWRLPLRGILCGSEWMSLDRKQAVERIFGCRVYRWYGHAERVVLAGEGARTPWFYFFPTYGYVEFGPPDGEGLREVIGTSFHNRAMPLIRYRTGDYVRLADGEREYPWPAVSEIVGRGQEFLVTAQGRRISLTAFNMHDAVFDHLYAVQFYQDAPGRAEFRYIPGPRFDKVQLVRIRERILEKLGAEFDVELKAVSAVEKTARGKHRWLISTLL